MLDQSIFYLQEKCLIQNVSEARCLLKHWSINKLLMKPPEQEVFLYRMLFHEECNWCCNQIHCMSMTSHYCICLRGLTACFISSENPSAPTKTMQQPAWRATLAFSLQLCRKYPVTLLNLGIFCPVSGQHGYFWKGLFCFEKSCFCEKVLMMGGEVNIEKKEEKIKE